jgi:hypothetical protein
MTVFIWNLKSMAYKRGKAGVGGWKADIKRVTSEIHGGADSSLKDQERTGYSSAFSNGLLEFHLS